MKNKIWLWIFLLLSGISCDNPNPATPPIQLSGLWDISFFQEIAQTTSYLIEVSESGESGTAKIRVYNDRGARSPDEITVSEGDTIPLGACGVSVIFLRPSPPTPLYLVKGDRWQVVVIGKIAYPPEPAPNNQSQAIASSSGEYSCLISQCSNGLYASSLPLGYDFQDAVLTGEMELSQIEITQNNTNLHAVIPEEHILSLYLVGHSRGDQIQLCYKRRLESDEEEVSFFRVRLVDTHLYQLLESVSETEFGNTVQTVCHNFQAEGDNVRIDFIFGLSDFNDIAWLDQIEQAVNGETVFSYDFEAGTLENDLAFPYQRFEIRSPDYQQGDAGVSGINPIDGNYSFRVIGGRELIFSGAIIQNTSDDLANSLGQFGSTVSGINFEIFEPFKNGYFASLAGAVQGTSAVMGVFSGEKISCQDTGQFIVSINTGEIIAIDRTWEMSLNGEAEDCFEGDTITFEKIFSPFKPAQKAERFYSDPTEPLVDDLANRYKLIGRISGSLIYFILTDYDQIDYRNVIFYGAINPEVLAEEQNASPAVSGDFNGWLKFESGKRCQTSGTFEVIFTDSP